MRKMMVGNALISTVGLRLGAVGLPSSRYFERRKCPDQHGGIACRPALELPALPGVPSCVSLMARGTTPMRLATFEGYVENGRIRLAGDERLPEKAHVYVVVTETEAKSEIAYSVRSPRLARPEQAALFVKEVAEDA